MSEMELMERKDLREEYINRIEVLERVKGLLLLPDIELATKEQVADFYETNEKTVMSLVNYHYDEFENDGYSVYKVKDLENLNSKISKITSNRGVFEVEFNDGTKRAFSHRGVGLFPRRAILRVGMLLRDSDIAKEVRTQLLNIEKKATEEQKIADITEEEKLALEVYRAKNKEEVLLALNKFKEYKDRHIEVVENKNEILEREILTWEPRQAVNCMIRKLAFQKYNSKFGVAWDKVYKEMLYKHGINIRTRLSKNKDYKSTIFDVLDKNEMNLLLKSAISICEENGIKVDDILINQE